MKKLLTIALLLICSVSYSQIIRNFLSPKGVIIIDTVKYLKSVSTYITFPTDSTMLFDSSKVGISLVKNATRDSFYLISGSGSILARAKDSTGSGGGSYTGANGVRLFGTVFKIPYQTDYASGAGSKYMWDSASGVFRAGKTIGTEWEGANLGASSVAFGIGNKASGSYSSAIGGSGNNATGNYSLAMGENNTASGVDGIAFGSGTTASGANSIALGFGAVANNSGSISIGRNTTSSGLYSFATGWFSTASGTVSSAFGNGIQSASYGGMALGLNNDDIAPASATSYNVLNRAFQIGISNTNATWQKANAITTLFNGNTGFGPVAPTAVVDIKPGTAANPPLKINYFSSTLTSATGTGTVVTLTYATTTTPKYQVGSEVVVSGVTPSGYNGTWTVTYCSPTQIKYTHTESGAYTSGGTIVQGQLLTTPVSGAIESDGTHLYWTNSAGTRIQLDN